MIIVLLSRFVVPGLLLLTFEPPHEKTNNVVFEQVQRKRSCTSIEDGYGLEILNIERRGIVLSVAKKKALISFAVTGKLVCTFGFAYADGLFSHEVAHLFCACAMTQ